MSVKIIKYDNNARIRMLNGVTALSNAVKVTLGPKGRNVVVEKSWGSPSVTKDGMTVAKEISLSNKFENLGAVMIREAAAKTSEVAGDGTTSTTILAHAIYREGLRSIISGYEPLSLKRGIDKAVEIVINQLEKTAKPVIRCKYCNAC